MLAALPQILPPQRLSSIKAVELLWDFERRDIKDRDLHPSPSMTSLLSFLEIVPELFPNLASLYLSLQGRLHDHKPKEDKGGDWFRSNRDDVLAPVDAMVRKLGASVKECTIAVTSSVYMDRRDRAKKLGFKVEHRYKGELERHWRSLGGTAGYWLSLGSIDMEFPYGCVMGGFEGLLPDQDWVLYGIEHTPRSPSVHAN